MEVPFTVQRNQLPCAKRPGAVKVSGKYIRNVIRYLDSFSKRVQGKNRSSIYEAVIAPSDQIRLWSAKGSRLCKPLQASRNVLPGTIFVLIAVWFLKQLFFYSLIPGSHRFNGGDGHLGFQAVVVTDITVDFFLKIHEVEDVSVMEDVF